MMSIHYKSIIFFLCLVTALTGCVKSAEHPSQASGKLTKTDIVGVWAGEKGDEIYLICFWDDDLASIDVLGKEGFLRSMKWRIENGWLYWTALNDDWPQSDNLARAGGTLIGRELNIDGDFLLDITRLKKLRDEPRPEVTWMRSYIEELRKDARKAFEE